MRWRYKNRTLDLGREGGSDRIEWFMWDDVTASGILFCLKDPSLNHRHLPLDRVNASEFELWRLYRFAKYLALEEQ